MSLAVLPVQVIANQRSTSERETSMSKQKSEPQRKPEKVVRIGFVSASFFAHSVDTDNGSRLIRSVSVQKRYTDGDEVKYTSSFNLAELPQAIRALQLAQQYVEEHEADINLTD